jgi:soluble lytic murein transglycosylase-like protein
MKIQDSLEQLARYNIQKKTAAGRIDVTAEKLKRFNTILDMFADDGNERQADPGLSALALLAAPVQSSTYGKILQALSLQQSQTPPVVDEVTSRLPDTVSASIPDPVFEPAAQPSEKERIEQSVAKAAEKYNLSENLLKGVIKAESAYNPLAVSKAGAQGLMQLMPGTARELGVTDAFDIDQNIDGGARYLRKMLDRYDGDVALALAAYNAGPGTVDRYKGNVPYRETTTYVGRVLKYARHRV